MDIRRKIQIIIGTIILIAGLISGGSFWFIGLFPILAGIFNLCPTCTDCNDGSCDIEKKSKQSDSL